LEELKWEKGQGARQVAFLCYSSGTSGLPKGVKISHRNVISNTLQVATFDSLTRDPDQTDIILGLLPQSHIYSLIVVCHVGTYMGDTIVNLPKFDFMQLLKAIQDFKISMLYLVPPIIIAIAKNKEAVKKFDLSSVKTIFTGAAPLGAETATELQGQHPDWVIRQGYGLTETCTVVSSSSPTDIWFGSVGVLLPSFEARLVTIEGAEISGYDQPGELVVKSPSVVLGYHNNDKATRETFVDGWMRTGDEAVVRKSESGHEHIWITDRIKELIKVKVGISSASVP
jgi:ribosome assembly protein SQT1